MEWIDQSDYRVIVASAPQGILLAHHWFVAGTFMSSLELLDPATDRLTTVTQISGTVPEIHVIDGPGDR
jgi:hypothetical protein